MAEQLQPESITQVLADFDRRLRNLEASARQGLRIAAISRMSAVGGEILGFNVWERKLSAQYVTDQGEILSGYPEVEFLTGSRVALIFHGVTEGVQTATTYRTSSVIFGIGVNGVDPASSVPPTDSLVANDFPNSTPAGALGQLRTVSYGFFVNNLTPGVNKFSLWCLWNDANPAAVNRPLLAQAMLIGINLG